MIQRIKRFRYGSRLFRELNDLDMGVELNFWEETNKRIIELNSLKKKLIKELQN